MIIVQTPLRLSLFGGGTDFPSFYREEGGCVLSTAINKYVFVTIRKRFDKKLRVGYTKTEIVDRVDDLQHELIREAFRKTGIESSAEVTTMGDIPAGAGLGSSGTVTVGSLHAMYSYLNQLVTAEDLARQACEIELDTLGKPIGVQDQYIAAFGGLRFIEFNENGAIDCQEVKISPTLKRRLNSNLIMFFTGITRKAELILAEQERNIHDRLSTLRKMKNIALHAHHELLAGNIDAFGQLLHESWQYKKQLARGISNGEIDDWYAAARKVGAIGGKISGAGGGGFLLLYCPWERQDEVRKILGHLVELPFHFEPDGSKVIFNYRSI
jgi:D-glycero-alpha-D-manno-heptose-7-phosphate kinase